MQRKQAVSILLARLAIHYYRPDFQESQAKLLIEDLYNDLEGYAVHDIEQAIKAYRGNAKNKFFPTSGQLIELATAAAKERAFLETHPKNVQSEFRDTDAAGKPQGRPIRWWQRPRDQWEPHWRESDIPNIAPAFERDAYVLHTEARAQPDFVPWGSDGFQKFQAAYALRRAKQRPSGDMPF